MSFESAEVGSVAPDWLAARLGSPGLRVVDVRVDAAAHARGHVPGAVALDVRATLFDDHGDVFSAPELAIAMSNLGIGDEHTVVLVDDGPPRAARAAAWALIRYGHRDVHVLDGGFTRWAGEGREVSRAAVHHAPASFTARVRA